MIVLLTDVPSASLLHVCLLPAIHHYCMNVSYACESCNTAMILCCSPQKYTACSEVLAVLGRFVVFGLYNADR